MISLCSLYQFNSGYTTGSIPQDKLDGKIFSYIDAIKNINTIRISNIIFDSIKKSSLSMLVLNSRDLYEKNGNQILRALKQALK